MYRVVLISQYRTHGEVDGLIEKDRDIGIVIRRNEGWWDRGGGKGSGAWKTSQLSIPEWER
jgi:hypothetical protein